MWSADVLALVLLAFFLGGIVKGVVGFGLPVVALAMIATTLGLKEAIALIVVPAITINIYQGAVGGAFKAIVRRIWPLLVTACAFTWAGVGVLAGANPLLVSGLLGLLLGIYAVYGLTRPQLSPPMAWQPWLSPVVGALSGIAYGLTGSLMVPGVIYLQALGFDRNTLVQALGLTFFLMTSALGLSLAGHDLMPAELAALSALALLPAMLGMAFGQRFRHLISEEAFRKLFFYALLCAGIYMVVRALI